MAFQVSASHISQLNSGLKNAQDIADAINATMAKYQIDQQPRRVRYFIAQSFFETQSYTKWVEDLYYSTPERIVNVWPTRFTMRQGGSLAYAPDYIKNPAKLANFVYANRNGNGDVTSGDGYLFRGRGAFHLTGKVNYTNYSKSVYSDLRIVANPDLVMAFPDAFMSAGWFWNNNGFNGLADSDSFTQVTRIINGSDKTVPQRIPVLNKVNAIFRW